MCGIFGIVSKERQNICAKIIDALVQLQNRGYDSSGLCLIDDGNLVVHKYASTLNESSLDKLRNVCNNDTFVKNHALNGHSLNGHALNGHSLGIGHNRWATHGQKNDINAHPHLSCDKRFAIVHNKNY